MQFATLGSAPALRTVCAVMTSARTTFGASPLRRRLFASSAVAAATLLAACGGTSNDAAAPVTTVAASTATTAAATNTPDGAEVRDAVLRLPSAALDGSTFDQQSVVGEDVLVWFWAPW